MLYVGRVAREKNLNTAVAAYRAAHAVDSTVRFVIVGDGPARAHLERCHPDLIFCGALTGHQLARHYASADVFLFPSETETFGNVTLEAMASGLAVIGYNYAAVREHIRDGQTGFAVPFGDRQAFIITAIRCALGDASMNEMRRQARQHAISLEWTSIASNFAALLLTRKESGCH